MHVLSLHIMFCLQFHLCLRNQTLHRKKSDIKMGCLISSQINDISSEISRNYRHKMLCYMSQFIAVGKVCFVFITHNIICVKTLQESR